MSDSSVIAFCVATPDGIADTKGRFGAITVNTGPKPTTGHVAIE